MKKKFLVTISSLALLFVMMAPTAFAASYSSTYKMYHGVLGKVCVKLKKGNVVRFSTTPNKDNRASGKYKIGTHLYQQTGYGYISVGESWNYAHVSDSSTIKVEYSEPHYFYLENQSSGNEFFSGNVTINY
ncbi:hypothetical protein AB1282_02885 [Gottfriedia sp. S16(2024)]|uniref:hypothetical protein n=1 Tax=Gottfriedia sp. S16(2024) TaxID=3162883 RepID=UPI003D2127B6